MPTTSNQYLPILCLAGPTGAGKTHLAISLAKLLDGEVINTDSRQVYRDFPIICAMPTRDEQAACPHHLYGFLDSQSKISAGQWRAMAIDTIKAILARNHTPILVGGTGMYFHALLHGIAPIPEIDPEIRRHFEARLITEGAPSLHHQLSYHDPEYAAKIHTNDRQRIVRALEVFFQTGETFTAWHKKTALSEPKCQGPLMVLRVDLDWLKPRLGQRIEAMVKAGALEEAKTAWERCPDASAPAWSGIGCMELLAYLQRRLALDEALNLWQQNTRAYAKRQNTWFRGRKEAIFFEVDEEKKLLSFACEQWEKLQQDLQDH